MAAVAVAQHHGRARVLDHVLVTPPHEGHQRGVEPKPLSREHVLEALRPLLVAPAVEDPVLDEAGEAVERMLRATPRFPWIASKRRTPKKASRRMSIVQRSPMTPSVRATEQFQSE